ncbi:MAG: peptidylprolyl isomerase [Ectothiorhodospira sp.]
MIPNGSRVTLHYTLALEDGRVADSTRGEGDGPVTFTLGKGEIHPALEDLVGGMAAGEHLHTRLPPERGFGWRSPRAIHPLPRGDFPSGIPPEPGSLIGFDTPAGDQVPGRVLAVENDTVTVDFNHPLAGHTLRVELEILSVQPPEGNPPAVS